MHGNSAGVLFVCLVLLSCVDDDTKSAEAVTKLHPAFELSAEDFPLPGMPQSVAEKPVRFLTLASEVLKMPPELLALVDKTRGLDKDSRPPILTALDEVRELTVARKGLLLDSRCLPSLIAMSRAAEGDGVILLISSAYRSYEYQDALFERYAEQDGLEAAEKYSARPGKSQHQLGTAVDFGNITNEFADSTAGMWMAERAGEFGWSLSYPQGMEEVTGYVWESWHWRWMGAEAVALQQEFFAGSQQRFLEFWQDYAPRLREARVSGPDTEHPRTTMRNPFSCPEPCLI